MRATQVASLYATLRLVDRFSGPFNRAIENATGATGRLDRLGDKFISTGMQAQAAFLPLTVAVGAGITAFTRWEDQYADVLKTVDFGEGQMSEAGITAEQFSDTLRDLATNSDKATSTLGNAHQVLTQVAALGGQLGISTDNLGEFTESMALLGVATNLTADRAAVMAAQYANITGLPETEFDNFSSAIVELGNNTATTEADIMNMALRVAAAGSMAGFSDAQILGLSATMSAMGIRAEAGGSAMTRILNEIAVAAGTSASGYVDASALIARADGKMAELQQERLEATRSLEAAQYRLANAGDNVSSRNAALNAIDRYTAAIAEVDAEIAEVQGSVEGLEEGMRIPFQQGSEELAIFAQLADMTGADFAALWGENAPAALQKVIDGLGELDQAQQQSTLAELGLDGIRVSDVLRRLAAGTLDMTYVMGMASSAYEENNALQEEAWRKSRTLAGSFRRIKNNVTDLSISFGETLAPAVAASTDTLLAFVQGANDFIQNNQETLQSLAPLLLALTATPPALVGIGGALKGLSAMMGLLSTGFAALTSPIGIAISLIVGLAVAIQRNLFGLGDAFHSIVGGIRQAINEVRAIFNLGGDIGNLQKALPAILRRLGNTLTGAVGSVFGNMWTAFSNRWPETADKVAETLGVIRNAFETGDWSAIQEPIMDGLRKAWDVLKVVGGLLGTWLTNHLLQPLREWFANIDWAAIGGSLRQAGSAILTAIGSGLQSIGAWFDSNVLQPIRDWWGGIDWGAVWAGGASIIGNLFSGIGNAIAGVPAWFDEHVMTPIQEWWQNFSIDDAAKSGGILFGTFLRGLGEAMLNIAQWLTNHVVLPISDFFRNIDWTGVLKSGAELMMNLWNGVGQVANNIVTFFTDNVLTPIIEFFQTADWGAILKAGLTAIGQFFEGVVNAVVDIGTWVNEHIIQPFIAGMAATDWQDVWQIGANAIGRFLDGIIKALASIGAWVLEHIINPLGDAISNALGSIVQFGLNLGQSIVDGIGNAVSQLGDMFKRWINDAIPDTIDFGPLGSVQIGNPFPDAVGMASGGPVAAGQPVIVGDGGREMFIPATSGRIAPASEVRGMGGDTNYTINVSVDPSLLDRGNIEENANIFGQQLIEALGAIG